MQPVFRQSLKQQIVKQSPHHDIVVKNPSCKQIDQNNMTMIKKIGDFSYSPSDKIGIGLTSNVYKGKNFKTEECVAIKMIDLKSHQDQLAMEFLKEEVITLEKIKNCKANYLLKLEGVFRTQNNLYIITEFCEGKDMLKTLKQRKVLSEGQAQTVVKQMVLGYQELYRMGIIHRDLKLSNLFITNGRIKLADFGFAIEESKCNLSMGYNAGSPKYMSPQCLKSNMYSFKGDVWSMGIMAYELVYGYSPWQAKSQALLYQQIKNKPIETLFDHSIPLSNGYKQFICKCLQFDLNYRASPEYIFHFQWPMAQNFVQGFQQQKQKPPQIVKVPGNSYAVYGSSTKQISYESKQLQLKDFLIDTSSPTQASIVSQLHYCNFLVNLYTDLKQTKNPQFKTLMGEISLTIFIKMKVLGDIAVMGKNRFFTEDFQSYIKSGNWENLKQVIIRNDIEIRKKIEGEAPARKNSVIPQTALLPQTITMLKPSIYENWRLIWKLLTYLEIREIDCKSSPIQFARKVNIAAAAKDACIPTSQLNAQTMIATTSQRLQTVGL